MISSNIKEGSKCWIRSPRCTRCDALATHILIGPFLLQAFRNIQALSIAIKQHPLRRPPLTCTTRCDIASTHMCLLCLPICSWTSCYNVLSYYLVNWPMLCRIGAIHLKRNDPIMVMLSNAQLLTQVDDLVKQLVSVHEAGLLMQADGITVGMAHVVWEELLTRLQRNWQIYNIVKARWVSFFRPHRLAFPPSSQGPTGA